MARILRQRAVNLFRSEISLRGYVKSYDTIAITFFSPSLPPFTNYKILCVCLMTPITNTLCTLPMFSIWLRRFTWKS